MQAENPLWTFSLVVYAEPGVQEECLVLQERHALDVNLLLLCAYAGVRGVILSEQDIAEAAGTVSSWHADVVRPLRAARRALKPVARGDAAAVVLIGIAIWLAGGGIISAIALAAFAVHLGWQVVTIDIDDPAECLRLFRSNRDAGLILFAGLVLEAFLRAG